MRCLKLVFVAAHSLLFNRPGKHSISFERKREAPMALRSRRFAGNIRLNKAAENNPPMRKGERGEPVQLLQEALIEQGLPMPITTKNGTSPADGIFGSETQKTVWRFQDAHGLQRDGIAGRETLEKLDSLAMDNPLDRGLLHLDRIKAESLSRWSTAH